MTPVELDRFWAKVDRSAGPDACWTWTAATNGRYGVVQLRGRQRGAHRIALELALGRPLSPGMLACHTCDNPVCVNASHLFEGTDADNAADRGAKARSATGERNGSRLYPERRPRGAANGRTKLTELAVAEIRALAGRVSKVDLARRYGISDTQIGRVIAGQHWPAGIEEGR